MKTKEQFMAGWAAFQKELSRRAIVLGAFFLVVLGLKFGARWLPRGTFAWMPLWVVVVLFLLFPMIILHRLIGFGALRRAARRCGVVCPTCGKALYGWGVVLKKNLAANKCPYCGLPLFIA
jgi:DNA-directed RNA polymerase subunit RPC12/RpoP